MRERPRAELVVRWPYGNTAKPEDIVKKRVLVRLEEHPYRREFTAKVAGHKVQADDYEDTWFLVRLSEDATARLDTEYALFHPEGVIFERGFSRVMARNMRKGIIYRYRASLEELLLNPRGICNGVTGRIALPKDTSLIAKDAFKKDEIEILAYARISRLRK